MHDTEQLGLGRNVPPDWRHFELYPMAGLEAELRPTRVPVDVGFTWYEAFFRPVVGSDGIARLPEDNLGRVAGGHSFCFEPYPQPDWPGKEQDKPRWWTFYNQGPTPACVGFAAARCLTLVFRTRFDPFQLYDDARRLEQRYPDGEGALVRSAGKVLVETGAHHEAAKDVAEPGSYAEGAPTRKVAAYRWLSTVDEVREALGYPPEATEFDFLNSWGRQYPEVVRMSDTLMDRLLHEEGEAAAFTPK